MRHQWQPGRAPPSEGIRTVGRYALPEHTVLCDLTGKTVLSDEVAVSDVTGALVNIRSLKTSKISGKRAEPRLFDQCAFTNVDALETELALSEISQKKYRVDEQLRSDICKRALRATNARA